MGWQDDEIVAPAKPTNSWQDDEIVKPAQPTKPRDWQDTTGDFIKGVGSTGFTLLKTMDKLGQKAGLHSKYTNDIEELSHAPDSTAGQVGSFAGDVGAGMIIPGGQATLAARLATTVGGNAVLGAALNPDDPLKGVTWGAGGAVLGSTLGRVTGGLVKPTPQAQALIDAKIPISVGQAAGKGSVMGRLEEGLASNPVSGSLINKARSAGAPALNVHAINQSIEGVTGHPVPKGLSPKEAVEHASDLVSKQYEDALQYISTTPNHLKSNTELALNSIVQEHPLLTPDQFKQMTQYVEGRTGKLAGNVSGDTLKFLDTEIGQQARRLANSPNAGDKVASGAWYDLQVAIRSAMEDGASGDNYTKVKAANDAYRNLVPIRKAISASDTPTPRQLVKAMERANVTTHPTYNLAETAKDVLPASITNTGTADRLLTNAIPALLLGGGYGANELGYPAVGTGLIAAGALGSKTGQKFMIGGYGSKQKAIAEALRRGTTAQVGGKHDKR